MKKIIIVFASHSSLLTYAEEYSCMGTRNGDSLKLAENTESLYVMLNQNI